MEGDVTDFEDCLQFGHDICGRRKEEDGMVFYLGSSFVLVRFGLHCLVSPMKQTIALSQ